MKDLALTVALAGIAVAVFAEPSAGPTLHSQSSPAETTLAQAAPAGEPATGAEEGPRPRVGRSAAAEIELKGKLVAEAQTTASGEQKTSYAIEIEKGRFVVLPDQPGTLPEGVNLAALVDKSVVCKALATTRTRGQRTSYHIQKVLSIEACE